MDYTNKDGGLWFNKNKKTEKQPDETGHVYIDHETLNKLNGQAQAGGDIKLELASWNRTAKKTGQTYKFLKAQCSLDRQQARPQQQYQQQSAYTPPQQPSAGIPPQFSEKQDIPF
jgi:hypothetical protein